MLALGGKLTTTTALRASLATFLMAMMLAGVAFAGPFEDGRAALKRGDYASAFRLLRPLAGQGNAAAQAALAFMYTNGQGVPQDYAEAAKWYRPAADQGVADAENMLGHLYLTGRGVPQDYSEAAKWFRKGADQGNALAAFNLGVMYEQGNGVLQNYAEAAKWWRLAADQGDPGSQVELGVLYGRGQGVPEDYVEAHKWFNLAASRMPNRLSDIRDLAIKNREGVAARMTPAQIAEAQKLAREWKPK